VRVTILCVGGVRGPLEGAIRDYEERAARYWRLRTVEVDSGLGKRARGNPSEVKKAEASRLLSQLPESGNVVAVTRRGTTMGSRELAAFLEERALRSVPHVVFILGGAFGLAEEVLNRATTRLCLSALTFPHEIARLLLAEQLYRAGTISRNEPYHKGP
jgi:23S rRNA (pseudouridine1915-N3)-methyltransferase